MNFTNTSAAMGHQLQCAKCPTPLFVFFYYAECNIVIFIRSQILFKCA